MTKSSNFPKFMLLWAGEFISAIGSGLTSFGLGIYVFNQTGSAASMALITLAAFLPTVLLSVPAGIVADRYDRRLLMMVGDGCSALGILYILICLMNGEAALWQICTGAFVSSVFSSLLEPAYRATVSDLLTKEQYTKASGLMSAAGSARYLISPVLGAALLTVGDIRLLLVFDICTFFPTVLAAASVRKSIAAAKPVRHDSLRKSLREGWSAVTGSRGVLILILVSAGVTCCLGTFQVLAQPVILGFMDSTALGIGETVCACGMLVTSLLLGVRGVSGGYVRKLSLSLVLAGACMVGFGLRENIWLICLFGFAFFAMLPVANGCLDYLVRTGLPNEVQGRAWGIAGFLSQLGYVAAYSLSGAVTDSLAAGIGISTGRGAALVIIGAGVALAAAAAVLSRLNSIRLLENKAAGAA